MKKILIGYGLSVLLYVGSVALLMLAMTGADTPSDSVMASPLSILLIGLIVVLLILALGLFIWSIVELKHGNIALIGVTVLSGLFLSFVVYRTIITMGFYNPSRNEIPNQIPLPKN